VNFFTLFFIYFLVLGIKPRALCILGKHSTSELHPQPANYFLHYGGDFSLMKFHLLIFVGFMTTFLVPYSLSHFYDCSFLSMFSPRSSIVSGLLFKSLICF
jgi:hypothetical protein